MLLHSSESEQSNRSVATPEKASTRSCSAGRRGRCRRRGSRGACGPHPARYRRPGARSRCVLKTRTPSRSRGRCALPPREPTSRRVERGSARRCCGCPCEQSEAPAKALPVSTARRRTAGGIGSSGVVPSPYWSRPNRRATPCPQERWRRRGPDGAVPGRARPVLGRKRRRARSTGWPCRGPPSPHEVPRGLTEHWALKCSQTLAGETGSCVNLCAEGDVVAIDHRWSVRSRVRPHGHKAEWQKRLP